MQPGNRTHLFENFEEELLYVSFIMLNNDSVMINLHQSQDFQALFLSEEILAELKPVACVINASFTDICP
jgi:hypothetical protein